MAKDVAVILAAAGKSSRFGDSQTKKVFALLQGRAVWLHSADVFLDHPRVGQIVVVIDPEDRDLFREKFSANSTMMGIDVVLGGAERWQSVQNALERVRPEIQWVAVHDAARPCIAPAWIDKVLDAAHKSGAAILGLPIYGTVKKANRDGEISETIPRDNLWQAQTPQVFKKEILLRAYANRGSLNPTDDAQLVEKLGVPIQLVTGSHLNIKITTREDFRFAESALKSVPKSTGFSFFQ